MPVVEVSLTGLFFSELLLLFLLSKSLHQALARLFFALTRNRTATVYILAVMFLPGTIVHELAHLFTAGVMLVPMGKIEIFPEIGEEEVRFGSAQVGQTGMLRRTIIGIAPFLVGLGLIVGSLWLALKTFSPATPFWQEVLVLLFIFEVGNTMFSSKKDMEGALVLILALLVVFIAAVVTLYVTGLWPALTSLDLPRLPLKEFLEKADLLLLVPLGIDLAFLGLAKALTLKTGQQW